MIVIFMFYLLIKLSIEVKKWFTCISFKKPFSILFVASVLILIRTRNAKSRLSHILGKEMREKLCVLMFHNVLSSVGGYPVFVLSPTKLEGDFTWIEDRWGDIDSVVERAFQTIDDDLLILPSDVPAITEDDIKIILSQKEDLVFVPAGDGGTNALFVRKDVLFKTHYGPKSFFLHKKEAEERKLSFCILSLENLRDIDTEEDLVWFYKRAKGEMKRFISSLLAKELSNAEGS